MASFYYMRTGNLFAAIASHTFCNSMGFPDFSEIFGHPRHKKVLVFLLFLGVALFSLSIYFFPSTSFFSSVYRG